MSADKIVDSKSLEAELEVLENQLEDSTNADELEEDINTDIPEKFRGKKLPEVVDMYVNLEKKLGQQGQEIGQLRSYIDNYMEAELTKSKSTASDEEFDLEDFTQNPKESIRKAVTPEIEKLEKDVANLRIERDHAKFVSKFPDFKETAQEQSFIDWVKASEYRINLYQKADRMDFGAAEELFTSWNEYEDVQKAKHEAKDSKRKKALEDATLDSGSGGGGTGKKVWTRATIIKMKVENPAEFEKHRDEIHQAYKEGRVR